MPWWKPGNRRLGSKNTKKIIKKNPKKEKEKKEKEDPSGENLETGATWGLCTPIS